ncbi:MAG: diguanylate cyclase [Methylococcaceae bacterium]|nr:diguanylate cyclase [Methylococcaceae bacterium]MDZ4157963.1 diguanylate cyclase [Methylococcales bacterium]MDP2393551.1 diguanylate cyclase [Methylococcaceae bacterium]MDP3020783.1 diguanylate cyclase [Methylococcaceae bacterium]MDP3390608.1 diguanylate cyclase [Methylococcaceae bacterium]
MQNQTDQGNIHPSFKIKVVDVITQLIKRIALDTKIKSLFRFLQLKKQLCASEAQQLAIFEQAPVSIAFTDLEFSLLKTNQQFLEQFGYKKHEIISLSDVFYTGQTDKIALENYLRECLEKTGIIDTEIQTRLRNGDLSKTRFKGKLINPSSNPQIVWILENITLQELSAANLTLAASVYQVSGAAMLILDDHYNMLTINPAFTEITGFNLIEIEIEGKPIERIFDLSISESTLKEITMLVKKVGHWRGELLIGRQSNEQFPAMVLVNGIKKTDGCISHYVVMFVDISDHKQLEDELRYHAEIDPLTSLPNRKLFFQRLDTAIASANRFNYNVALLYLDLDGFKQINDSLGHGQGDNVLIEVAGRLMNCIREVDTVARLGGDEFVVILNGTSKELIAETAQRILDSLTMTVQEENIELPVSASIGIAIYPEDNTNPLMLLKFADEAMYRAKYKGKRQFCWHGYLSN